MPTHAHQPEPERSSPRAPLVGDQAEERVTRLVCKWCQAATLLVRQRRHAYTPTPQQAGAAPDADDWRPALEARLATEGWTNVGHVRGGRTQVPVPGAPGRYYEADVTPVATPLPGWVCGRSCADAMARALQAGHPQHQVDTPRAERPRGPAPMSHEAERQREQAASYATCSYAGCDSSPLTLPADESRWPGLLEAHGWIVTNRGPYCSRTCAAIADRLAQRAPPPGKLAPSHEDMLAVRRREAEARERNASLYGPTAPPPPPEPPAPKRRGSR